MVIRSLTAAEAGKLLDFYQTLSRAVTTFYQPFGPDVKEEVIVSHLRETEAGKHINFGLVRDEGVIEGHSFILSTDAPLPVFGIGLRESVHGLGWGRKLMNRTCPSSP